METNWITLLITQQFVYKQNIAAGATNTSQIHKTSTTQGLSNQNEIMFLNKKETKKPNSSISLGSGQECQNLLPAVCFHCKVINSATEAVIV